MTEAHSIRHIPEEKLYVSEPNPSWFGNGPNAPNDPSWTNKNWLKSRFHFSFAEYSSRHNLDFGVMRVMNDDLVQPRRGFGTHPHSNMEIITYIVEGRLTHQDSMGTKESLGRGSVQFMTAGRGISHSEFNDNDKPLRFIQTWIKPDSYNLQPNYGSFSGDDASERVNQWQHLVSGVQNSAQTPVKIHQDADCHTVELDALGKSVTFKLPGNRQAYILCMEGSVSVNDTKLKRHDACEVLSQNFSKTDETTATSLTVEAVEVEKTENGRECAHVLMFTMKATPDSGRSDLKLP